MSKLSERLRADNDENEVKPLLNNDTTRQYASTSINSDENPSLYRIHQRLNSDSFDDRSIEPGNPEALSQKYESLDYDICENTIFLDKERDLKFKDIIRTNLLRWVIIFFIGTLTAITGCIITISIEELSSLKYGLIKKYFDKCVEADCLEIPFVLWISLSAIIVCGGSMMIVFVGPCAAGSGIPVIKSYLNGIKIPEVVRFKTLVAKVVGVILGAVGGLAIGQEGPMIHCGAIIAAGISQGKSTTFKKDFKLCKQFREDHEKRDFVSAGAAAGVAAAFGAPVGGVLFSLEEGASFWNQLLTWRIFFCSMISAFTLDMILSAYHLHPFQLSYDGLLNFGKFQNISYGLFELPIFMVLGVIGGLLGALFNYMNFKLTVFRMKYVTNKWLRILEVMIVAMVTVTTGFLMIFFSDDCQKPCSDPSRRVVQFNCPDGKYSSIGTLWFQTPEASVRSLFHDPSDILTVKSLGIFFTFYYFLACWTYGLTISSGLFVPTLLAGAAWGRLAGLLAQHFFDDQSWIYPGKFALIGAAAMLGGVVRMTISLTVIMIEATGDITFGLPLMITLMVAKWVGDFFNEGLYDIHIQLAGVPYLGWEAPPLSHNTYASAVMSCPVVTLKSQEKVDKILNVLINTPHNGFPVVDNIRDDQEEGDSERSRTTFGIFRGIVLRWQLIVLLQHKVFNETAERYWSRKLTLCDFRDPYPRYPSVQQVHVSENEQNYTIDLQPFINPSAFTVRHNASLPRIFHLFRALGLRHIVVCNDRNEVIGMVTRKDLARYRTWKIHGRMGMTEIPFFYG